VAGLIELTGRGLTLLGVAEVARRGATVEITGEACTRIKAARATILDALTAGVPVYGLTTGLGQHLEERIDPAEAAEVSLRTVRGRAVSVGDPLERELVRAAMLVRLNGLCAAGSGASVELALALAALLNAGVHPRIPRSGSVGAADICMLAHIGLTLVGEGEAELDGSYMPSAAALERAGLHPIKLGPKDGLALCSSSAVSVGTAALVLLDCREVLRIAQVAVALSMEGFRANLSPIDVRAADARPAPGQRWAAAGLRRLLAGGALTGVGAARRLQDPLSFRCASQVHGSLQAALEMLDNAVSSELNAAADNPLVIAPDGEVISTGNFHTPALALALDATAIAVAQIASLVAARPARLASGRLSELPVNLTAPGRGRSGVGPLLKTAEALLVEIRHLASPLALHPSSGADGVEDDSTNAVQAARRLREQLDRVLPLLAIELVCAAQAVDLAQPERLGAGTGAAHRCVRELVGPLEDDRALGADVERLYSDALVNGGLLGVVEDALSRT
jgi:histidine ammonia-lyase